MGNFLTSRGTVSFWRRTHLTAVNSEVGLTSPQSILKTDSPHRSQFWRRTHLTAVNSSSIERSTARSLWHLNSTSAKHDGTDLTHVVNASGFPFECSPDTHLLHRVSLFSFVDTSVEIVTRLQAGGPRNCGSIPGEGKKIPCLSKQADRDAGPPSLLIKGYRGRWPQV
jgi:hypothetical protein